MVEHGSVGHSGPYDEIKLCLSAATLLLLRNNPGNCDWSIIDRRCQARSICGLPRGEMRIPLHKDAVEIYVKLKYFHVDDEPVSNINSSKTNYIKANLICCYKP